MFHVKQFLKQYLTKINNPHRPVVNLISSAEARRNLRFLFRVEVCFSECEDFITLS